MLAKMLAGPVVSCVVRLASCWLLERKVAVALTQMLPWYTDVTDVSDRMAEGAAAWSAPRRVELKAQRLLVGVHS